jgi:LmbE family N-acetylglucosaminyl deacetylase
VKMAETLVRPVYLSPHLDDAVLSCGALMFLQSRDGNRPTVITCFAGIPERPVKSSFALEQHTKWGLVHAVRERRREDSVAQGLLGSTPLYLDYFDCIYRRGSEQGAYLYTSEAALFGQVHPGEEGLPADVASRLLTTLPPSSTDIYAPLGLGHHVDHQLTLAAALLLRKRGCSVLFYEDYPYAEQPDELDRTFSGWHTPPTPIVKPISETALSAKVRAISAYRSQLPVLFGDQDQARDRIAAYARRVGGGSQLAERYWQGGEP